MERKEKKKCAYLSKNVLKHGAGGCHVANAFLSRSELIWPISRLKIICQNV